MEHIVRVYRYSDKYKDLAYPVADIPMSAPIRCSEKKFAIRHGGDYIKIISNEEEVDYD
jgi:hypothetical protein